MNRPLRSNLKPGTALWAARRAQWQRAVERAKAWSE